MSKKGGKFKKCSWKLEFIKGIIELMVVFNVKMGIIVQRLMVLSSEFFRTSIILTKRRERFQGTKFKAKNDPCSFLF